MRTTLNSSKHRAAAAIFLGLALSLALPYNWAKADPNTPNQAANEPAATQEGKFIQDLGDQAMAVISNKRLTQDQHDTQYHQILHNSFDLTAIGRFVIGRSWNTATPEQQQEYMKLFEDLVVKIYGDRLNFYKGESFHVMGSRAENDKDSIVNSEIVHPDGSKPTTVDWRVRHEGDKLAVVDVMIEGVSQSVTQRQEYSSIIQRDGGKIEGLLQLMRQRVQVPPQSINK